MLDSYLGGGKVKLFLCLISQAVCHEDIWGSGGVASPFLTPALDGSEWSGSCPGSFTSREIALSTHCILRRLISVWLYKENYKLWVGKMYLLYIFPPELHTLMTSLF
jgi:hypothetical protein